MNIIPKLFEKIIKYKLMHLFTNVVISEQYGFRYAKSTITNTLVFYSYLVDIIS